MSLASLVRLMRASPDCRRAEEEIFELMTDLATSARVAGFITQTQLQQIARLKSERRAGLIGKNSAKSVQLVTEIAFLEADKVVQISLLKALHGVDIPVASAILSWTFPDQWPVIDKRAWSVLRKFNLVTGCSKGRGFRPGNWVKYVAVVAQLADALDWSPQEVDTWLYRKGGGKRRASA